MKDILKIIIPDVLLDKIRSERLYKKISSYYKDDYFRFIKYAGLVNQNNSQEKIVSKISLDSHVIEKGLTMPEMKECFGETIVKRLINNCFSYLDFDYEKSNIQFQHAIGVLLEYENTHQELGYKLNNELKKNIEKLANRVDRKNKTTQLSFTKESYFSKIHNSFDLFSASRHSIRNLAGKIEDDDLVKAIKIAMNAPSSCNRQPSRVYIVKNKEKIKKILKIQKGHRGFGYLADKIIILTAETSVYNSIVERNSPYIDGALFGMNLLYSLQFNKIAACVLNCYFDKDSDLEVRKLLKMPDSEVFIFSILVGNTPNEFKVPLSKRNNAEEIITKI